MQPNTKPRLWRDSVAAGDDIEAPHEVLLNLPPDATAASLCSWIASTNYLPMISGGRATWILEGIRPIAVLAQQWPMPKLLLPPATPISALLRPEGGPQFKLLYWCQVDPELVHQRLLTGQPLPDKYST